MEEKEKNAYILGTHAEELHRLGLQHQVWASNARQGWSNAEFGAGQTILDLGCGPGFTTIDLGYMVGAEGKVIAVDKSKHYLDFLENLNGVHQLNIQTINTDFDHMMLAHESIDGMYCRWALAWVEKPQDILKKVYDALVPGGAMVIHEYYHWGTFQMEPVYPELQLGIDSILANFKSSDAEIDIGRYLPKYIYDIGMEIISSRPMTVISSPEQVSWQWPKTFLEIFMPNMVETGHMTKEQLDLALDQLYELEEQDGATIFCPQMIEIVAIKP